MELNVHSNSDVSGLAAEASAEVARASAAVDCVHKQEWKILKLLRKQRRADVMIKIPWKLISRTQAAHMPERVCLR